MVTRSSTPPSQTTHRRSNFQPMLAINAPRSLFTRIEALSLSSPSASFATSTCAVCYAFAHFTLGCPLLPRVAPPNNDAVREGHIRGENICARPQRTHNSNRHFNNSGHFYNDRHPSSSPRRDTEVSWASSNAMPSAKKTRTGRI